MLELARPPAGVAEDEEASDRPSVGHRGEDARQDRRGRRDDETGRHVDRLDPFDRLAVDDDEPGRGDRAADPERGVGVDRRRDLFRQERLRAPSTSRFTIQPTRPSSEWCPIRTTVFSKFGSERIGAASSR